MDSAFWGNHNNERNQKMKSYKFDKLPKTIKEKVIEKNRYINVDLDNWSELHIEDFKKRLEKMGYENINIFYNGFYSQGDGACFIANINILKYIKGNLKNLIKCGMNIFTIREVLNSDLYLDIKINRYGHYYHEKTMDIDFNVYDDENPTEEKDKFLDDLKRYILAVSQKLAREFYQKLENAYDYLTSEEIIIETLMTNGYKFNSQGEITG